MMRARLSPRGVIALGFDNGTKGGRKKDSRPRNSSHVGTDSSMKSRAKAKKGEAPELGQALRSVYDSTLNEQIPPEMLDLLGKLG
jgi:hypothetical protein